MSGAVLQFKAKLKQAALNALAENQKRIAQRETFLKDTAPSNPAWTALHQVAQVNAHIEGVWQALSDSIVQQITALSGHSTADLFRNAQAKLRLSDQRDALLQSAYLGWSRTHPEPNAPNAPTPASNQKYLAQFHAVAAPLLQQFASIARVEDARDYMRAQYPEVAALSADMGVETMAKMKNTKASNAQLGSRLSGEYDKVQAAINKVRAKLYAGELPLEHMDLLVQQVMNEEGIKPGGTDYKSEKVNAWLAKQQANNAWTDIGLALATVGFTVATVLAPEFVLPVVGALATGGTLAAKNYLASQDQLSVSTAQGMGGKALSSVSSETAKVQVVLAQVDALLLAGGVAGVVVSGVSKLPALSKGAQALAETGGYRWAEGAVRTGPFQASVSAPRTRAALDSLEDQRAALGLKPFALDIEAPRSTVAVVEVNGEKFYGVNSAVDTSARPMRRDALSQAQSAGLIPPGRNLGTAQAFTHAEAHALMQAKQRFGTFPERVTLYVDRESCNFCIGDEGLKALADLYQIRRLVVIDSNGKTYVIKGEF